MSYQIKELGVTEILDQAFTLIKNHFAVLFGIALFIMFPYFMLASFLPMVMLNVDEAAFEMPADQDGFDFDDDEEIILDNPQFNEAAVGQLGLFLFIIGIAGIVVGSLTNASVIYAVSKFYIGSSATIGESIRFGFGKILPLIGLSFVVGLLIMLGFIALIIPGIYLSLRYIISQQVMVIESRSVGDTMKRCKELMKDNYGKAFSVGILMWLISFGVNSVTNMIPQEHVQMVVYSLVQSFTSLLSVTAFVVFYFSARCQHENYDLQLLADSFSETVEDEYADEDEYED